jgi:hypothetical protein
MKRPDMKSYFHAQIDQHVNGMMARTTAKRPVGVLTIEGTVTDSVITVTMHDGTVWVWRGGKYAARKVNGCYAPLMPRATA